VLLDITSHPNGAKIKMSSKEYNEVITEEYILRRAAVVVARKSRYSIIANAEAENALPQFQPQGVSTTCTYDFTQSEKCSYA